MTEPNGPRPATARVTIEMDGVLTVVNSVEVQAFVIEQEPNDERAEVSTGGGETFPVPSGRPRYMFRLEGYAEPDDTGEIVQIVLVRK